MNKGKVSSLTHVLQIGRQQELDTYQPEFYSGYFDEQNYYHSDRWCAEFDVEIFAPWEWVVDPEIVELAKRLGIEIPQNPTVDISKSF